MISIHRYSQWYINCKQINLRIHGCFPFKNKCCGAINFKATHPKAPPVLVVGARDSRVLRGMSDDVYYATTHWNISAMFHRECLFPDVSGNTSTAVVMFCVWHVKKTKGPRINTYMMTSVLETGAPFANMVGLTLIPAWISNCINDEVWWNYLSIPKLQRLHRRSLGMDK